MSERIKVVKVHPKCSWPRKISVTIKDETVSKVHTVLSEDHSRQLRWECGDLCDASTSETVKRLADLWVRQQVEVPMSVDSWLKHHHATTIYGPPKVLPTKVQSVGPPAPQPNYGWVGFVAVIVVSVAILLGIFL